MATIDPIKSLLPPYAIVGENDIVPGIKGSVIDFANINEMSSDDTLTIYVHSIIMKAPSNISQMILKAIILESDDLRTREKEISDKNIKLSLEIECHNTWKALQSTYAISLSTIKEGELEGAGKIIMSKAFVGDGIVYILRLTCVGISVKSQLLGGVQSSDQNGNYML